MNSPVTEAWSWLGQELDRWSEADRIIDFWWRDDDATDNTVQLEKLLKLSKDHNAPLALAVIPSRLKPGLVNSLQGRSLVSVLQHGFAHQNHAAAGQRKLELGGTQTRAKTLAELRQGHQILSRDFAASFNPVLVPPWNRINVEILSSLSDIGFSGISTMKVRRDACPAPGLLQVNTHLDPVNWRHGGGFIGVYPAIAILIQHLQAKRNGYRDSEEPTGILTHHLAHNDAVWRFVKDLLQFLGQHPAVRWQSCITIWP